MTAEDRIRILKDAAETWMEMARALRESDPAGSFRCFQWSGMMKDAAEALEERIPVETEIEGGGSTWWHVCGECHTTVDHVDRFCRQCGRPLKWDGKTSEEKRG